MYWGARLKHVIDKSNPDDELLATAKEIKRNQLREIATEVKLELEDITNTFWWSGTVVRIKTPAGAAGIDSLSAQSKLFRGIAVIVPFAGPDRLVTCGPSSLGCDVRAGSLPLHCSAVGCNGEDIRVLYRYLSYCDGRKDRCASNIT